MATGTTGRGIAMEAIRIFGLPNAISYRAHVAGIGWLPHVHSGETAGTIGQSRQMEAIQFQNVSPYSLMGRAHIQNIGWTSIINVSNGEILGTTGKSLRMEAIQLSIALPLNMLSEAVAPTSEISILRSAISRSESSQPKRHEEYLDKSVECMLSVGMAGATCAATVGFGCSIAGAYAAWACSKAVVAGSEFLKNEVIEAERERVERENLRRDIEAGRRIDPGDGATDLPKHDHIA